MKKLLFGLGLLMTASVIQAQTLLDGIVVEKVHTATQAEHDQDVTDAITSPITAGAVTYRIWVDMATGAKLASVWGNNTHALKFSTTTNFYNNDNIGAIPTGTAVNKFTGTANYDSWVTLGGNSKTTIATYQGANVVKAPAVITNLGLPLSESFDTYPGPSFISNSGTYTTTNGEGASGQAYANGTGTNNMILIGQFTTDGIFSYELNLQVTNGTISENYAASDVQAGEFTNPTLKGASTPNTLPFVALTAPTTSTVFTPATITLSATASDAAASGFVNGGIGAIDSVVFFNGATRLGKATLAAGSYSYAWTPAGSVVATITAKAYDNDGASVVSTQNPVVTVKAPNVIPTITLVASATAVNLATAVTLTATPVDVDGTITKVEFFEGVTSLGSKTSAPWTLALPTVAAGAHSYTAVATDNEPSTSAASTAVVVTATNSLPTISTIVATPSSSKVGTSVSLSATAGDVDGIATIAFYEGATLLGTGSPLVLSTLTVGTHSITAVATDNNGGTATASAVTVTISANQAPVVSLASSLTAVNLATALTLTATATDGDGSIKSIEFFDGATSLGAASLASTKVITALTAGTHTFTAKAIDNSDAATTSAPVVVSATNANPTISAITASATTVNKGTAVTLSATAGDVDGTATIAFFNGSTQIGTGSPLSISTLPVGTLSITAVATDNNGASVTSAPQTIVVNAVPSITSVKMYATADHNKISDFKSDEAVTIAVTVDDASAVKTVVLTDGTTTYTFSTANGTLKSAPVSVNHVGNVYFFAWVASSGTHTFNATASNGSVGGSSSVVFATNASGIVYNQVVSFADRYVISLPDSAACNASDFIDVPVIKTTGDTLSNVTGFDIVMNYDKSKVTPTGEVSVNNSLVNHLYIGTTVDVKATEGKINISVYLNGNGNLASFNGTGLVASVKFVKTPLFRSIDTVLFTASLVESYATKTTPSKIKAGSFRTYKDTRFTGDIKFWADNSAIQFDTLNPTAHLITNIVDGAKTVQPNLNGIFTISNLTNTLSISRDIDGNTDVMPVINGYDALLTAEVAVESKNFTPNVYQIIAMDVNRDGKISAGDVSQINRRTVLSIPAFVQVDGTGKDWLFVDKADVASKAEYQISTLYPLADGIGYSKDVVPTAPNSFTLADLSKGTDFVCASTRESYVGILVGDANGNYKNITSVNTADYSKLKSGSVDAPVTASVVFDYAKATTTTIEGINYLDVPVVVSSDIAVNSLDFALNYDAASLQYSSIVSTDAAIKTLAHVGDDNTLRFTSYSVSGFATGVTVVSVRFQIVAENITANGLSSIKAYVNGEKVASNVTAKSINPLDATVLTSSIYPNPASDVINVIVSQTSKIEVINVLTQVVYTLDNAVANQIHAISTQSFGKGTFYVKVTSASSSLTKIIAVQ